MCDEKHCNHGQEDLCSCAPVQGGDPFRMAVHLAENMSDVDWRLTYNSLKDINPYRLCMVGKCRVCGGRLCIEQKPFGIITTDDFFSAAYRHLYQFHHNLAQPLSHADFRSKFVEMFRKEDRATVEEWLARPENQSVHTMYRRSVKRAYTIVHSWADADQGEFPSPSGMATFMDKEKARTELERLVAAEKENMEIPFSKEQYREEYGDDYWEAYRDGYAAGWFTRYEIIESPLFMDKEGELTMPNMSYCRFTNTRTDLNDCLDSIRRDERLSEMEMRDGRKMFEEFLTFCRDYDIIDDYDGQQVNDLFQSLRERDTCGNE